MEPHPAQPIHEDKVLTTDSFSSPNKCGLCQPSPTKSDHAYSLLDIIEVLEHSPSKCRLTNPIRCHRGGGTSREDINRGGGTSPEDIINLCGVDGVESLTQNTNTKSKKRPRISRDLRRRHRFLSMPDLTTPAAAGSSHHKMSRSSSATPRPSACSTPTSKITDSLGECPSALPTPSHTSTPSSVPPPAPRQPPQPSAMNRSYMWACRSASPDYLPERTTIVGKVKKIRRQLKMVAA